ncbi:hypothetical protein DSM21852_40930 [Methylocystis bryophila]|nr:hypothetical protein DSM21852_40930 [Methylocystis bryophila]
MASGLFFPPGRLKETPFPGAKRFTQSISPRVKLANFPAWPSPGRRGFFLIRPAFDRGKRGARLNP